jgi:hypothetical protein
MTDTMEPAGSLAAGAPGPAALPVAAPPPLPVAAPPPFAHHSEAELARILDFYEVRWEYEPHVYPILWSLEGVVQESFAPDFYLPDLDLYVELTTLRQRLVRKKNRKLRRLRELYPDIRIKLFYERDFRALMLKYGKLAIADEMTGTVGQMGSVHLAIDDPSDPAAEPRSSAARTAPAVVAAPGPAAAKATTTAKAAKAATAAGAPVDARPSARRPRRTREATTR